jgi:hypothetical protein
MESMSPLETFKPSSTCGKECTFGLGSTAFGFSNKVFALAWIIMVDIGIAC